ncbi:MAG: arsenite efflux transporter metallochaperone ArsD [Pirellulaceae bacterium]
MKTIHVYDKPQCCSTGVCGPDVDPVLVTFAADLQWLASQGHQVERFNLAQQANAFLRNREVEQLVTVQGTRVLPIVMVDDQPVSQGRYPSREELNQWTSGKPALAPLPVMGGGDCCGGSCC